jgi:hypothetical protein
MTWFIPVLITFAFTVAVGIVGHITTARGCLQPEETFPRYYSGIELVRSDITVMRSSGDMSTTGHIMTGDSTALNFEVKDGDRALEENIKRGNRPGCPRFAFQYQVVTLSCQIDGFSVPDNQHHFDHESSRQQT